MDSKVIHLADGDFSNYLLNSDKFILVDFWADWCGPCKMVSPILEEIAEEYSDKSLIIAKLNIEDNPVTASKYSIRSIPTLILFKDNEVVINRVGSFSKGQLKEFLDTHLSSDI